MQEGGAEDFSRRFMTIMMKEEEKEEEATEINVSKNINDETRDFNLKNAKRLWGNAERFQGI